MQPSIWKLTEFLRNTLALGGVLALGWYLGSGRTVKAAATDFQFQLAQVNETSSLLVYQPSTSTVYVYKGATTGSSNLQCSTKFVLSEPGRGIRRDNCDVPTVR